ncbi:alpha-L-rhamnosidase [Pantoea agglomerans]|uniref:family 78 glycoside hydrolase catalytic domain n=1 Tax=Enterobacter agglomerans TaxID=549 RepID=UPI0015F9BF4D|nr:family 78 glycoside hydrolase catalytic domain [Pantoea agglomerans]MBA8867105.1 alpha-L-rhamnosidase [Pantoea agglomerans]MBA8894137.1 alpha-L-rhamnosidase [Pantoea agglomerans]
MKIRTSFTLSFYLGLSLAMTGAHADLLVSSESLMTNLQPNPLLIEDLDHPSFSWRLDSSQRGEKQTAYRIIVSREDKRIPGRPGDLIWDSGKVASAHSSGIRYNGPELSKATRYFWTIQVWDKADKVSTFSDTAHFDTAIKDTWQAKPIWHNSAVWKDYTVEFDLNIVSSAAGFYLRAGDKGAYKYQFRLSPDGSAPAQLLKSVTTAQGLREAGKPVPLRIDGKDLKAGSYYRVKFEIAGNVISTLINGVLIDRHTDASLSEGAFGIWAEKRDDEFRLKNLSVRSGHLQLYKSAFDGSHGSPFPIPSVRVDENELIVGLEKTSPLFNEVPAAESVLETRPDWVFLRKTFRLKDKPVSRAVLYATGQSPEDTRQYVYRASINGHFAGLGPARGYDGKHFYNAFDITEDLHAGEENVIGAIAFTYGEKKSFMAELRVVYADGEVQSLGTDDNWKTADGSSTFPYAGDVHAPGAVAWVGFRYPHEDIAGAHYPEGFDKPGFDDSQWLSPLTEPAIAGLTGYPAENLTEVVVKPRRVTQIAPGHYLLDYGTTVVGGMRLNIHNPAQDPAIVTLKTGEVMNESGGVKWQTAALVNNLDKWEIPPGKASLLQFGFRVFRYAEVSGLPSSVNARNLAEHLDAVALRYPFNEKAASFSSSNSMLNKIWAFSRDSINVLNHDLYIDSPNRERAPYEADTYIQQLSNYQLDRGYALARVSTAWLIDHSTWPMEWKIYNILNAWNDYLYTGDDGLIRDAWERLQQKLPAKLMQGFNPDTGLVTADYGDGKPGPDHDIVDWPASLRAGYQFSDTHNVANAFFFRGTQALSDIAGALGKEEDEQKYRALSERSAQGFRAGFYDNTAGAFRDNIGGQQHVSSQANAFGVAFGIAGKNESDKAADFLAGKKMLEGSVYSSLFALSVMAENGQATEAINQITGLNDDGTLRPGTHNWRHMIEQGSGSTMEAWNESDDLTVSHSHPWGTAPVIVAAESLFGIRPLKPAYALFQVKPVLNGLRSARIKVPTIRGDIHTSFTRDGEKWELRVSVPANTEADIYVPAGASSDVRESGHPISEAEGIQTVVETGGYVKVRVGSGDYLFNSTAK